MKYKKILIIIVLLLATFLLYCYNDTRKKDMYIVDVKVYDKDGVEIIGEYKDYYSAIVQEEEAMNTNSAAPVINYYCVKIKKNSECIVKFYFRSARHYKLTKLDFVNDAHNNYKYIECSDIEKKDEDYIVTLKIDSVTKENRIYKVINWYDDNNTQHYFTEMGSNTYLKGVYFYISDQEDLSCKKF